MPMPVIVAEPAVVAAPSAPAVYVDVEPAPMQPAPVRAQPAPAIAAEKALQESGLVMIQTDPRKVKPAEAVAEPQEQAPQPRPRRAPPPDTGPLQIVETKK